MKTFFIISSGWDPILRARLEKVVDFNQKNIIVWGLYLPQELIKKGWNVKSAEDYLKKEDYCAIDEAVFHRLSSKWYLYENVTQYEGIHLGRIIEYSFQKFLIPRLKNIILLERIIQKEKVNRIVVIEGTKELKECLKFISHLYPLYIEYRSFHNWSQWIFSFLDIFRTKCRSVLIKRYDQRIYQKLKSSFSSNSSILVDSRIYLDFEKEKKDIQSWIPLLLEEGLNLRLKMIRRKKTYFTLLSHRSRISFREQWRKIRCDEIFKKQFCFNTINLWPMVEERLRYYFYFIFPLLVKKIQFLDLFFKHQKIGFLLLRNNQKEDERLLIHMARRYHISSAVFQHGILAESNGHSFLEADHFLAWGKTSQEWYKSHGEARGNFFVVGNPKFDDLQNWKPSISKKELYTSLHLDPDRKTILWVTQQINLFSSFWTEDLFYLKTRYLLEALEEFENYQLIIKVDPYEKIAPYQQILQSFKRKNGIVVCTIDIYTLIYYSDLLITMDSTAALEAFLFKKPVITFNLTKREDRVPYAYEGAALKVSRMKDLPIMINLALYDIETQRKLRETQDRFLNNYAYQIDGEAHKRISKFIDLNT